MLQKAMEVLGLFSIARAELGVVEAAELLGRPKSSVSRLLASMEHAGFLERDAATARYRISLRIAALGQVAKQTTSLQRAARPILEALAAETGETANVTILVGLEGINIEVANSPRPVMHMGWVGRRLPAHSTAAGRVLLAFGPQTTIDAVLARPLKAHTPNTVIDPGELRAELVKVRGQGHAMVCGELEPALAATAAPVFDHRGEVIAAIAIGGPVTRCPPERMAELARMVMGAAAKLSVTMGHTPPRSTL